MKKLLCLLFCFIIYQNSFASHSVCADITYTHLFAETYRIRLSFYRDCDGISAPVTAFININSDILNISSGVSLYPLPGTGQEVLPICPGTLSTCQGGTFIGIQEWIYEGDFTFPNQSTDWILSFSLCCRNSSITTITNPGINTIYVYSLLNNTIFPRNNSSTFLYQPVPFLCIGQPFCYKNGAIDIDGDSIVYSLITPYQTATTNVNYIIPYSALNPLASIPPVAFYPATGAMCVTPTMNQITVMSILIQEYRNGVLIGEVLRDNQIVIYPCSCNPLPIELLYFKGEKFKTNNILKWSTASEINNDYFEIYRSNNGNDFNYLSNVNGHGTTTNISRYNYIDTVPFNGKNYYKLKQVDFNGQYSESRIICINSSISNEEQYIEIYDIIGKSIIKKYCNDYCLFIIKKNLVRYKIYFIKKYKGDKYTVEKWILF